MIGCTVITKTSQIDIAADTSPVVVWISIQTLLVLNGLPTFLSSMKESMSSSRDCCSMNRRIELKIKIYFSFCENILALHHQKLNQIISDYLQLEVQEIQRYKEEHAKDQEDNVKRCVIHIGEETARVLELVEVVIYHWVILISVTLVLWEQDRIDIAEGQQVLVRCIKYYSDERVHVWRILKIHEGYVSDDLEIREHAPYLLASNPTIENQDIRSTYNSAERTTLEPKRAVKMITIVSLTMFKREESSIAFCK